MREPSPGSLSVYSAGLACATLLWRGSLLADFCEELEVKWEEIQGGRMQMTKTRVYGKNSGGNAFHCILSGYENIEYVGAKLSMTLSEVYMYLCC